MRDRRVPPVRHLIKAAVAVAVALALRPGAATAALADTRTFNLPAQELPLALDRYSGQAGVQVTSAGELIEGKMSSNVSGTLGARAALELLLTGTGLRYDVIDSQTVVIMPPVSSANGSNSSHAASISRDPSALRLSQANPAEEERSRRPSDERASSSASAAEGSRRDVSKGNVEEVVVTGSHIRGVQETAAPSMQFTREDIAKTGYSTIEQLFASLPQNFSSMSVEGQYAYEGGSRIATENFDRASGIDLRGIGADSTLTLLNGQRRAGSSFGRIVDVSSIPLSAIERVEIVTGGRSAVYGADAVAGVVNLVTRREFKGVESQVNYGGTANGGERLQLSTITGVDLARGGFAAAYDFSEDWALDLVDIGLFTAPDVYGGEPDRLDIQPRNKRHSALLSGHLSVTDNLELHADGLFSHKRMQAIRETLIGAAPTESMLIDHNTSDQYSYSLGAELQLVGDWVLNVDGSRSVAEANWLQSTHYDSGDFALDYLSNSDGRATVTTAAAVADGPLFTVAGVTPRAAVGLETRRETYDLHDRVEQITYADSARQVRSAFAELLLPLVEAGRHRGMRRLELTLASRYDDYDDFGNTFNPQAGLILKPVDAVTLRAAYSKAFRAPGLIELLPTSVVAIENREDPATGDLAPVLQWTGSNTALGPERARTWSFGVDVEPTFAPGTRISLSYFDISFKERIDQPAVSTVDQELVLVREDRFAGLVHRAPAAALIAEIDAETRDDLYYNYTGTSFDRHTQNILDVFPNLVVFDNRTSNIAVEKVDGVDLQFATQRDTAAGRLSLGLNGTYTLNHDRSVTVTSPSFELLNEVGKPVAFRFRASAGWERGAYAATAFLNYTDSYSNPYSVPAGSIASWTTADANVRIDGTRLSSAAWLDHFNVTLSVSNLFDRAPPRFVGGFSGLRYDVANSNPIGRYVSLRLMKAWR